MKSKFPKGFPKVIANARLPGKRAPASAIIQFRDDAGLKKLVRVPKAMLLKPKQLTETLANENCPLVLQLNPTKLAELLGDLKATVPTRTIDCTFRTGWIAGQFVLPDLVIGADSNAIPSVMYEAPEGDEVADFGTRGTLEEWKQRVALLACHSATMTFVTCLAFAAPLLEPLELEGGGIHLDGKSSKGKSLSARVARSVSGPPRLLSWSTTVSGLERAAASFNGSLMCVDEAGALEGSDKENAILIRNTAFKIGEGVGKLRGKGWETKLTWRTILLSTGETSLEDLVKSASINRLAGEEVRFPNLPCGFGEQGVFETLPRDCSSSAELVDQLEAACKRYHGTAFRAFVARAVQELGRLPDATRSLMDCFYEYAVVSDTQGWERRFARKFALAAAAGILAARWKILPWSEDLILRAVKLCYRRARKAVPDAKQLLRLGMARFKKRLRNPERIIDLRGMNVAERKFKVRPLKGLIRHRPELGLHLLVRRKDFPKWFKHPQQAQLVLHELQRLSRLKPDPRDPTLFTRQVQLWPNGPKNRYYVITVKEKDVRSSSNV